MRKTTLSIAVTAIIGTTTPQTLSAEVLTFDWDGVFTMLDGTGAALANSSIPAKGNNQFLTPISGTLTFDTDSGSGSMALDPVFWFSGTLPLQSSDIELQAIGDGMDQPGTLMLANMLFAWGGTNGIPVSMVLDAAGLLGAIDSGLTSGETVTGTGATPAVDGTYVGTTVPGTTDGYITVGPSPIATTDWDTSLASGCSPTSCMGVLPSGTLPLVTDTATNLHRYDLNTPTLSDLLNGGLGIGGNPMPGGPFSGSSVNFDITSLTYTTVIDPPPVPVPAAIWLFGSGLLGLAGFARRKPA